VALIATFPNVVVPDLKVTVPTGVPFPLTAVTKPVSDIAVLNGAVVGEIFSVVSVGVVFGPIGVSKKVTARPVVESVPTAKITPLFVIPQLFSRLTVAGSGLAGSISEFRLCIFPFEYRNGTPLEGLDAAPVT